ncbi:MAG: TIGR00730 family Rossman fold protein [Bdellovibrionales bacterium]|nr:TIGR00730 family Rossman fold protein [Bdellovibrionales bacterium]
MRVGVFCSCSDKVSPFFLSEIESLGETLAKDGHEVIYGGATGGCMGRLADGVRAGGGRLVGVLPEMDFMDGLEHAGLCERHVVRDLASRKTKMNEIADAFIIYPGGIGTLDEAFEVLALKSCGSLRKPVIFYNFMDVWTPLIQAMEILVQQQLIRHPLDELLVVLDKPEQVREHLRKHV